TVVTAMGANHNFFNTTWTPGSGDPFAADDWTSFVPGGAANPHCGTVAGNRRLTAAQQRAVGLAYTAGFFRLYMGLEFQFLKYFVGDFLPPTLTAFDLRISYHPPSYSGTYRRDVNRLLAAGDLTTNTLGGAVTQGDLVPGTYGLCGG